MLETEIEKVSKQGAPSSAPLLFARRFLVWDLQKLAKAILGKKSLSRGKSE
jgi:hypothetical protein